MARRLEVARRELLQAHHYQHRVVNDDDVTAAVTAIERILIDAGLPPTCPDTASTCPPQHKLSDHQTLQPAAPIRHTPSGSQT